MELTQLFLSVRDSVGETAYNHHKCDKSYNPTLLSILYLLCQLSRDILCTIVSWFKNIWCKANNVSCFFVSVCKCRNKTLHMIHCHVLMGNTMLNHLRQESQRRRVTRKSRGDRPGPTTESRACLVCCIQHYYWRSST